MSMTGMYAQAAARDLEALVLGGLLAENRILDRLIPIIGDDAFHDFEHADLWRAARERIDRGEIADSVALKGRFDAEWLVTLETNAPLSGDQTLAYARDLAEIADKRALARVARTLGEMAADPDMRPADAREWLEGELTASVMQDARLVSMEMAALAAYDAYLQAKEGGYPDGTVLTGIDTLDHAVGGFRPGHLTLVCAAASMGKSLLANRIAIGAAHGAGGREGVRVIYITPEMQGGENVVRMAAARMNVAYAMIERGELHEDDETRLKDELGALAKLPITFREGGGQTPADLARLVRSEMRKPGVPLGLVIVDPLGFIRAPGEGETERGTATAEALQSLAAEIQLPIVATHHLRKLDGSNGHRPTGEDIRGSGRFFDYANEVLLLHRDAHWAFKEKPPEDKDPEKEEALLAAWKRRCEALDMDVLVAKRRGGAIGWRKIGCNVRTGRFWDLETRVLGMAA